MDHQSKNSHHCRTSVVQLNSTLGKLGRLIECVPSKVNSAVTEITNEFVLAGHILHDTELKEANEEKDLELSVHGDGVGAEKGGKTVGVGVEGIAGGVNVSGDVNSSTGNDVTQEGKLANTAVLDLDVTKTIEAGLAGIVEQAEGVEETERGLCTELTLEGVEGGGDLAGLCGGKCGGGGDKSDEGSELHHGDGEMLCMWSFTNENYGRGRGERRRCSANTSSFMRSWAMNSGDNSYLDYVVNIADPAQILLQVHFNITVSNRRHTLFRTQQTPLKL